jgi:hypothetical protein
MPDAVADGYRAFGAMQQAIHANDRVGLTELLTRQEAWLLDSGTAVKVLRITDSEDLSEPHRRWVEVRVLDGPRAGKAVTAPMEYLRRCRWAGVAGRKKAGRRR